MTLDEAIKHAQEVMTENLEKSKGRNASDPMAINCFKCAEEHRQLAEWLKDYKRLSEQEQKTGHWIMVSDRTDWYDAAFKCSCCGREITMPYELKDDVYNQYPYCHCGAKMESEG